MGRSSHLRNAAGHKLRHLSRVLLQHGHGARRPPSFVDKHAVSEVLRDNVQLPSRRGVKEGRKEWVPRVHGPMVPHAYAHVLYVALQERCDCCVVAGGAGGVAFVCQLHVAVDDSLAVRATLAEQVEDDQALIVGAAGAVVAGQGRGGEVAHCVWTIAAKVVGHRTAVEAHALHRA